MCVYLCAYTPTYVYTDSCMHVCMYVWYVRTYGTYVRMYVCVYVHMCIYVYIRNMSVGILFIYHPLRVCVCVWSLVHRLGFGKKYVSALGSWFGSGV